MDISESLAYVADMQTFILIFVLTVESIYPNFPGADSAGVMRDQVPVIIEIQRKDIEACWDEVAKMEQQLRISDHQHYRAICLHKTLED